MENNTRLEASDYEKARQYILELTNHLLEVHGTEIFITAGSPPAFKIGDAIERVSERKLVPAQTALLVCAVMSAQQLQQFEQRRELNFSVNFPNFARFTVRAFTQRGSIGMVMRLMQERIPSISELHLPSVVKDLAMETKGLVVLVGSAGSGKTTSVAAMLDYRNQHCREHIVTIEDPIEFFHRHQLCIVEQREVGTDTDSYESAIRSTLRQAPNVLFIGETNSRETLQYAINFAGSGRLCLTIVYANSVEQACDRMIGFFPEERREQLLMDLSFNMRAFIFQRLLAREDQPGMIPAVEVVLNTPLVADLLAQGRIRDLKTMMTRSREDGVITLDEALFDLYESGRISYETAVRNADSINTLRLRIKSDSQRFQKQSSKIALQIEEKRRNWNEL